MIARFESPSYTSTYDSGGLAQCRAGRHFFCIPLWAWHDGALLVESLWKSSFVCLEDFSCIELLFPEHLPLSCRGTAYLMYRHIKGYHLYFYLLYLALTCPITKPYSNNYTCENWMFSPYKHKRLAPQMLGSYWLNYWKDSVLVNVLHLKREYSTYDEKNSLHRSTRKREATVTAKPLFINETSLLILPREHLLFSKSTPSLLKALSSSAPNIYMNINTVPIVTNVSWRRFWPLPVCDLGMFLSLRSGVCATLEKMGARVQHNFSFHTDFGYMASCCKWDVEWPQCKSLHIKQDFNVCKMSNFPTRRAFSTRRRNADDQEIADLNLPASTGLLYQETYILYWLIGRRSVSDCLSTTCPKLPVWRGCGYFCVW